MTSDGLEPTIDEWNPFRVVSFLSDVVRYKTVDLAIVSRVLQGIVTDSNQRINGVNKTR